MILTWKNNEFQKVVEIVEKFIPKSTTERILMNINFTFKDEQMTVISTDNKLAIVAMPDVRCYEEFSINIDSGILKKLIKKLKKFNDITWEIKDDCVIMTSGKFSQSVPISDGREFPIIDDVYKNETFDVSFMITKKQFLKINELFHTLNKKYCQDNRYYKCLFNKVKGSNNLEIVGTDTVMMFTYKLQLDLADDLECSYLIPAHLFDKFKKMKSTKIFKELDELMIVSFNEEIMKITPFSKEDQPLVIYSRLCEKGFPDYRRIIPQNCVNDVNFSNYEMQEAIDMVSDIQTDSKNKIVLDFNENKMLEISASCNLQTARYSLAFSGQSDYNSVAFNGQILKALLKTLPLEDEHTLNIIMQYNTSIHPATFKADGGEDILWLLMPIHVR